LGNQKPKAAFIYIPGKLFITQDEMLKIRNNIETLQMVNEIVVVSKYGAASIDSTIKIVTAENRNGFGKDLEKALSETQADIILLSFDQKYLLDMDDDIFLKTINLLSKHLLIKLTTPIYSFTDEWSGLWLITRQALEYFLQNNNKGIYSKKEFQGKLWAFIYKNTQDNHLAESVKNKILLKILDKTFLL